MLAAHMHLSVTVQHDARHTQQDLIERRILPLRRGRDLALIDPVIDGPQPWEDAGTLPIEVPYDIDPLTTVRRCRLSNRHLSGATPPHTLPRPIRGDIGDFLPRISLPHGIYGRERRRDSLRRCRRCVALARPTRSDHQAGKDRPPPSRSQPKMRAPQPATKMHTLINIAFAIYMA
ncbi:hypothetical protein GLI01_17180 [Gluconacetobacter liquefaciens]|nr:hypothetical protein GLI01_17180 [Gluconacetobacter liquefaciens]